MLNILFKAKNNKNNNKSEKNFDGFLSEEVIGQNIVRTAPYNGYDYSYGHEILRFVGITEYGSLILEKYEPLARRIETTLKRDVPERDGYIYIYLHKHWNDGKWQFANEDDVDKNKSKSLIMDFHAFSEIFHGEF